MNKTIHSLLLIGALSLTAQAAQVKETPAQKVPALAKELSSPLASARRTAAEELGKIGEPAVAAIPALIRALADSEVTVRSESAWALGKIKNPSNEIVPALIAKLTVKDEQWPVRHNAALSLSWIGKPAAPQLRKVLESSVPWARAYAADALYRISPEGAYAAEIVPVANQLLTENDVGLKIFVSSLAGQMGEMAAGTVPALVKLLGDSEGQVRSKAMDALPKIGQAAEVAVPQILKSLQEDAEQWVRIGAAFALGDLGRANPNTIPGLVRAMGDKKDRVGAYAVQSLAKIGEPAVPALIEALAAKEKIRRMNAADAFAFIGSRAGAKARVAAEALVPLLDDKEWEVRSRAAVALGVLGDSRERVVVALNTAWRDENETVRLHAGNALQKLGVAAPATEKRSVPL